MKKIKNSILFIVFVLIVAELGLRLIGFETFKTREMNILECDKEYVTWETYLGFANLPGEYECYTCPINNDKDTLSFNIKHLEDGSRFTGFNESDTSISEIGFYGCSFTWGQSLNDNQTIPYKVQSKLDSFKIKNYAIGASSLLHANLMLKYQKEHNLLPDIVIFNYASFQDMRVAFSLPWRHGFREILMNYKHQRSEPKSDDLKEDKNIINYVRLSKNGKLRFKRYNLKRLFIQLPFSRYSVLSNTINGTVEKLKDRNVNEIDITLALFEDTKRFCESNNVDFVVFGIDNDATTKAIINALRNERNFLAEDISLDFENPKYNLRPFDDHPSEEATRILSISTIDFLTRNGLIIVN